MQSDIDREKPTLFQQNRETITAKLPRVQNKEKTRPKPKHTRLLLGAQYDLNMY